MVQPPPRFASSCVLLKPPYFYYSDIKIPWITFFFHQLRQRMRIPSRDLFTFWGDIRRYTSITHQYHIYVLTPTSSALVDPSYLMMGFPTLLIFKDDPNDHIPRSEGTASEVGWTLRIKNGLPKYFPRFFCLDRCQNWERTWPGDIVFNSYHHLFRLVVRLTQLLGNRIPPCKIGYDEHRRPLYWTQCISFWDKSTCGEALIVPPSVLHR